MEMHALLQEINGFLEKIKTGTATLNELEAFAAATQQLNERAIILKYKAYETEVYGVSADDREARHSAVNTPVTEGSATAEVEETEKTEESVVPSHTSPKNTVEPILPSTPISQPETSEDELSFDLFSMDDSEEVDFDQPQQISQPEQPAVESNFAEPQSTTEQFPEEKEAEIIAEPAAAAAPEIKETPKAEPAPAPAPTPVSATPSNEHPVLKRARTNDGSLQSRLLSVRLETLKNAFGLNERILIVKELFGGDNDLYNSTIEELDNAGDIAVARTKMNSLANQFGWREESELAIEFVQKVERRYA